MKAKPKREREGEKEKSKRKREKERRESGRGESKEKNTKKKKKKRAHLTRGRSNYRIQRKIILKQEHWLISGKNSGKQEFEDDAKDGQVYQFRNESTPSCWIVSLKSWRRIRTLLAIKTIIFRMIRNYHYNYILLQSSFTFTPTLHMLQRHFIAVISLLFISYKQFTHFSYHTSIDFTISIHQRHFVAVKYEPALSQNLKVA